MSALVSLEAEAKAMRAHARSSGLLLEHGETMFKFEALARCFLKLLLHGADSSKHIYFLSLCAKGADLRVLKCLGHKTFSI